jgi:hypothetical protein
MNLTSTKMKKTGFYLYVAMLGSMLLFNACVATYVPNVVNAPLLSNKGELQAGIHTSVSGFDPQLAYALSDHFGLMANGHFCHRKSAPGDAYHYYRRNFAELGGGYYTTFGSGRFETFAGIGHGKYTSFDSLAIVRPYYSGQALRYFIQPGIGVSSGVFDGSLSSRLTLVHMYTDSLNKLGSFVDPVLSLRFGYRYVKLQLQLGFSIPLNDTGWLVNPFMASIGLHFTFGKNYHK